MIVCESHTIPGGAAHTFRRRGFEFDSGPSFYCGLTSAGSLNPIKQVLEVLGESLESVLYDLNPCLLFTKVSGNLWSGY
ncbi:MAG: hypothetical protein HC862_22445 [Scytonema sp. RU_4_4]|nr:hypothetical protein [Scytonema sp. RU_4_4]NJR76041.1 hypothetical protein [Scytonema sp. CRU_2_7]